MTHLPKSELVGVLAPYSINTRDIGLTWFDIGAILTANFITYLGNGIVIAGNGLGRIYRSTDYGNKWNDTGAISAGIFKSAAYLGNGIVLAGDDAGHIFRNTNFGNNGISAAPTGEWVDQGAITAAGADINTISYLGKGIVIFGASDGHIFRHINFGDTAISAWVDLGNITGSNIVCSTYLENGIVIVGTTNGHVWRSTNSGAAWSDMGIIVAGPISSMTYIGNGIAIFITPVIPFPAVSRSYRSNNFGATWVSTSVFSFLNVNTITYLGNGNVIVGGADGHIYRSNDYGFSFSSLGAISLNPITHSVYLDNGIALISDSNGEFFRSDVSYKTNESQVNYPRIISGDLGPGGANTRLIDTVAPGTNIYTNLDKTRTLIVSVGCTCTTPAGAGAAFDIQADSTAVPTILVSPTVGIATGLLNEYNIFMTTGYVGPGLNYRLNQIIGGLGVVTLDKWFEMYI